MVDRNKKKGRTMHSLMMDSMEEGGRGREKGDSPGKRMGSKRRER